MNAEDKMIQRLLSVFGEPKTPNPELFLEEFAKAIKGWDARVLEEAGDRVIRSSTFWPKPAELIEEATAIAAAMYAPKATPLDDTNWPEPSPEAKARVDALLRETLPKLKAGGKVFTDPKPLPDVSRQSFETTQRESPNTSLHAKHGTLTDLSKRMMGETGK